MKKRHHKKPKLTHSNDQPLTSAQIAKNRLLNEKQTQAIQAPTNLDDTTHTTEPATMNQHTSDTPTHQDTNPKSQTDEVVKDGKKDEKIADEILEHPPKDTPSVQDAPQAPIPPASSLSGSTPVPYPKSKKSSGNLWLWVILALLCGAGLGFCVSQKNTKSTPNSTKTTHSPKTNSTNTGDVGEVIDLQESKAPVMAVEAIHPTNFVQTDSLVADGVIAGGQTAMVGARASGLSVEEVFVEIGDRVKKGDVLAVLDDKFAKQEVLAMTADKKQAQINLEKVSKDFERIQELMDINAISWQQYDSYKSAKEQAKAQLDAIEARLASVEQQETNTSVIAPMSGIISEKMAFVGMVTTGGALFGIVKTDKVEWQAQIKASDRQKVFVGQTVRLKNGATGKVARISPTANTSRDLTVFITLNDTKNLPVGSYQTGEFVLAKQSVLTIPAKVVMSYDGGDFVWVIDKVDDKALADSGYVKKDDNLGVYVAKKQKLANAKRLGDKVAIELPKETLIIKSGGNFLSEGDWVTLTAIDTQTNEQDEQDERTNKLAAPTQDNTTNDKIVMNKE